MAKSPRGFLFNFVTDIKQIIMNAHTIFERDLNGEMVSPSDPGYDELIHRTGQQTMSHPDIAPALS